MLTYSWLLVACTERSRSVGCWLFVICCWLFVVGYLLFVFYCSMLKVPLIKGDLGG